MNRRSITRVAAALVTAGVAAGLLAGCAGGSGDDDANGKVTITWWHNATSGDLPAVWEQVAKDFSKDHPNVVVKQTGYQNEDLQRTLIPNALAAGDPPDLFQTWGGGETRDQVANGYLMPLDDKIPDTIKSVGATVNGWQFDGKTYGIPYRFGIEGFWYNKDLFAQAGISETPTTFDELKTDIKKLKDAGITPVAVGAGDKWPAAHWWYQFALHSCSPDTLKAGTGSFDFSDPCWVEAGQQLKDFIGIDPFQDGFLGTPAQTGAGSSAGLVANGQAAMELMGDWNSGVIGGLTPDEQVPDFLSWFPFPGIEGAAGDAKAQLGNGDAFACSKDAPKECAELLAYIMSPEIQKKYAESGSGIPTVASAQEALTDDNLKLIAKATTDASFVQLYFDTAFGTEVGNAMNEGIVNLFAGKGSPQDIVDKMTAAAKTVQQ